MTHALKNELNANQSPESFLNTTKYESGVSGSEKNLIFNESPLGQSTDIFILLRFVVTAHLCGKAASIDEIIVFPSSATLSVVQVNDHLGKTYKGSVGFVGALTAWGNREHHFDTGVSTEIPPSTIRSLIN